MNNINNSNDNIVQSTSFAFSDILKAIPLWMSENIAWYELYGAIGKTLDTLLDENLITLAELRDPKTLNATLLPLAAAMLGFRWQDIDAIDLAILRTIVETITSYYSVNGAGAVVIEKALFEQYNDPYKNHVLQPPLPPDFDVDDFTEIQTTAKIVSFILNTVIVIEPLWTRDYRRFYTTAEASSLPFTWFPSVLPVTANWDSIAFGDDTFIAIESGAINSAISNDGIDWTIGGSLPGASNWSSIAYGNGIFLTVASNSTISAYSFNKGVSWVLGGALPINDNWTDIAYGGGTTFVVIAYGNNLTAVSNDSGFSWSFGGNLPVGNTWSSLAFGNDHFVAIATNSNTAAYSIDNGATWISSILPIISNWDSIAFGQINETTNIFMAVASNSTNTAYSLDDGQTWVLGGALPSAANWTDLSFGLIDGNPIWLTIASGSTASSYSLDNGITWLSASLPSSATWSALTFGRDLFVTVASGSNKTSYSTMETLISYTSTIYPKYNPTLTNPKFGPWYLSPHVNLIILAPNVDINYSQLVSLFYYLAPITMVIESIYEPFTGEARLFMTADPTTYTTTFISTATQA